LGAVVARISAVVVLAVISLWIVSGGAWRFDTNPSGSLYGRQAEAFRAGQLALLEAPPEALLALPDPYDPRQWRTLPIEIDLSLFDGRFYLYFGPAPALAMLALVLVRGAPPADGVVGLAFALLWLALLPVCLAALRSRLAPTGSWVVDLAGLIAIGLGAPVGAVLGRLATYETAILAGQAFLALGLALGAAARNRSTMLVGAGLAFGLAAASRLTLLPALVVVVGVALLVQSRVTARAVVALIAPLLAVLVALALYNAARFGTPWETGWRYQLTALPQHAWLPQMFQVGNLPVTANWYLTRPPIIGWAPPWLWPRPADATEAVTLADWFYEPLGGIGIMWTAPLALVGLGAAALLALRRSLPGALAGLWLAALAAALPSLLFRAALLRYQLDFLPLLLLAATLSVQRALPATGRRRGVVQGVCLLGAAVGASFGLSVGIALRNSRAGFAEAEGVVAMVARQAPAVATVVRALEWVAEHGPERTVALIVPPLPGTPATIDVGSPPQVDVAVASADDACWPMMPGPAVGSILSAEPTAALRAFEPPVVGVPLGPTVYVRTVGTGGASPAPVAPTRWTPLCPITGTPSSAADGFSADHFRRYRTRAFWSPGAIVYQPVEARGVLVVRLLAHGARNRGQPPEVTIELRRQPDSPAVARRRLTIENDWTYAPYEVALDAAGVVYPTLVFDGPMPAGPWWAVAVASLEAMTTGANAGG
jgi:hypothetical protein